MNNTEPKKMDVSLPSNTSTEPSPNSIPKQTLERKWVRILRVLLNGSLNRFEAARHGDTCLNSTISELTGDHLVEIDREWEVVMCRGGQAPTNVKRYRIRRDEANLARVRRLLGMA